MKPTLTSPWQNNIVKTITKAFKRHRCLKTIPVAALASLSAHPLFEAAAFLGSPTK